MKTSELHFFNTGSSDYSILAATEFEGLYFTSNGNPYSSFPREAHGMTRQRNSGYLDGYKEISLVETLRKIKSKDGKQKFLKILKLSNPNIQITEEDKEKVISKLRNSRAFNEDSALFIEEIEICFVLAEQKLIKECEGRFYIEKDLNNIKDFRDIPLTQAILNV